MEREQELKTENYKEGCPGKSLAWIAPLVLWLGSSFCSGRWGYKKDIESIHTARELQHSGT